MAFAAPRPRDEDHSIGASMKALAALAGWRTVPHHEDHEVVRMAIKAAKRKHDPDVGGSRALVELVEAIEDRWLELVA